MPQHVDAPPETDILCEHCGYGLNGLPTDGLCPECGLPIADSTTDDGRTLPPWESVGPALPRFVRTVSQVIFTPANFFRHLKTRTPSDASAAFASRVQWISAFLLGTTAIFHADAMKMFPGYELQSTIWPALAWPFAILFIRILLSGITRLASSLTRWEGAYWGYRLPAPAVRRVMNYHSCQLFPVAVLAFITVAGYWQLREMRIFTGLADIKYLIVLCIEVLFGAGYLFRTYWIAMKNIMYANR